MTPQDTLARFDEIREAAEFEMQQEMAAIAQAWGVVVRVTLPAPEGM